MQSTSVPPWHTCYYPIPRRFFTKQPPNLHFHFPIINNKTLRSSFSNTHHSTTQYTHYSYPTLYATTHSCCKEQQEEEQQRNLKHNQQQSHQNSKFITDLNSSSKSQNAHFKEEEDDSESKSCKRLGIFSKMWWAELKAAVGQRINVEGLVCSVGILAKDRHLVIPHVRVPDVRYIDWSELKDRGFKGVVFDKDNTLTIPYCLSLWEPLGSSLEECKSLFGNNVAVFSNSAGLQEYDIDGKKATALEREIGIKVIRHRMKKPAGTAEDIERHFGCESSRVIMVGDRPFTDIVYGNRNGFLTILTDPLSVAEEPFIVKQVRILEVALVNRWSRKGLKATNHRLLPQPEQCVKDRPQ